MEKLLSDLMVGTIAGLVATFFAVVFARIWKSIIEPWYEERIYQDAKIEGRWVARTVFKFNNEEAERVWEIRRVGHHVHATITSTSGYDKGRVFLMEGNFKNLVLTGSYTPAEPSRTDRGTYTLRLINDGQCLKGVIAAYAHEADSVECCEYVLTRLPEGPGRGPAGQQALGAQLRPNSAEPV